MPTGVCAPLSSTQRDPLLRKVTRRGVKIHRVELMNLGLANGTQTIRPRLRQADASGGFDLQLDFKMFARFARARRGFVWNSHPASLSDIVGFILKMMSAQFTPDPAPEPPPPTHTADAPPTPDAIHAAEHAVGRAVELLRQAAVPQELHAQFVPMSRRWLIRRPARFASLGHVWRVGALLLEADGSLWSVGKTVRSQKREILGIQSEAQELRRDLAGVAFLSGIPEGTQVNYDTEPLHLDRVTATPAGPLVWHHGAIRVRWRPGASPSDAPSLEEFFADRIALLCQH